ncbi:restriction endonuclease [Leuconostoc carnosum]|uniref:DpnII family type II restriction endonuclease n=1 Tax=Leuconostoc carnosum TaxID=1252 RepID=UPI00123B20FB|nr:DpnII family type II restriction endonuclease [Leuconostoc carnosum]KAA8371187.1 restriction endonuclease [Leuconostoc carnosum]KAA8382827.1 restriction endonuclease [Leuconostoc carnosum]
MVSKMNVYEYRNLPINQRLEYFVSTLSNIEKFADYWVNFDNVYKNVPQKLAPDLFTLDYLIGKNQMEIESFFHERPYLLMLVPLLLGIRKDKLDQYGNLSVQDIQEKYQLNFNDINIEHMGAYFDFLTHSGLMNLLSQGLKKSVFDYSVGVQAGMDSNGRKNRSGKIGEKFLEERLSAIASKNDLKWMGQSTPSKIKKEFDVDIEQIFKNRRFDGALYNPKKLKIILFEINLFNASGSKSKSASTEFQTLRDRLAKTNHEFIYITDGEGWLKDKSHLKEALEYIGNVFNVSMVEDGYIESLLDLQQ